MWSVYVVRASDNSLYCGVSTDVGRRVNTHNASRGAKSLRGKLPVVLVCSWECPDRSAALRDEAAFKRLTKRKKEDRIASRRPTCD